MARAFVLTGGSRSQLGLLENARALGYEVCVVDGSESAPLLAEADYPIVRSFTEVDRVPPTSRHRASSPWPWRRWAPTRPYCRPPLAERLGLPGSPLETAKTVADKRRMRKAFEKASVRCPRGREANPSKRPSRRSTSSGGRWWSGRSTALPSAA